MGEHRALGQAGGAAGVLQDGDIIQRYRQRADHLPRAPAQDALEGNGLGQLIGRHQFFHLVDHQVGDPAFGGRHHVAHSGFDQVVDFGVLQHFLYPLAEHVQVHQRPNPGALELMAHLARGVERVGIDHNQACTHGSEHGNRILQGVGHLYGNTVARLEIGVLLQITGKRGTVALKLGIGDGHSQIAEGRAIRKLFAGALKHVNNRFKSRHVDIQRYTGGTFVIPEIRLHCFYPRT